MISLVAAGLIWLIAYGDIRVATRSLLTMEGITVALIVVVVVVIFARVFAGTAPSGQSFTLSFTPPSGVGLGTVALAAVFGLLSFGGFEGAASLGEETNNPPPQHTPRNSYRRVDHGRLLHYRHAGPDSWLRDR